MIEKLLASLNFTPEETQLYLALLESGPITAGDLAKKTGTPRPSLYGFLNRLIEKGATTQSLKNGIKIFIAEQPEVITKLFRNKIEELENHKNAYENMIPALQNNMSMSFTAPRFEFFEGREGVQNVLKDLLLYSGIETQSFWPIQAMVDLLSPEFFHYHNKIRIRNKTSVRALWPEKQVIDMKKHPYLGAGKDFLREIRVAPPSIDFTMGYWIYKNKIAFLSSQQESYGFIIESRELVTMQLAQFETIWAMSKKIAINDDDLKPFIHDLNRKN
jgi:sugar-specific transcriptional regulator TrmB